MNKLLVISSLFIAIMVLTVFPSTMNYKLQTAYAANSTPSADVSNKLKALQAEIASQASKIKQEIGKKLQNKVFAGFIKTKSNTSLTLATLTGIRMVNINEYTDYQGKIKTSLKNLAQDDYVIALGDIDESEVLTARRVIKTASPSAEIREVIFGQVVHTSDQTISIQDKDTQTLSISVTDDTNYTFGKSPSSFDNIKLNNPIIVIGIPSVSGIIQARFIYIFPYTANIKPKIATPSASTSSAKKK